MSISEANLVLFAAGEVEAWTQIGVAILTLITAIGTVVIALATRAQAKAAVESLRTQLASAAESDRLHRVEQWQAQVVYDIILEGYTKFPDRTVGIDHIKTNYLQMAQTLKDPSLKLTIEDIQPSTLKRIILSPKEKNHILVIHPGNIYIAVIGFLMPGAEHNIAIQQQCNLMLEILEQEGGKLDFDAFCNKVAAEMQLPLEHCKFAVRTMIVSNSIIIGQEHTLWAATDPNCPSLYLSEMMESLTDAIENDAVLREALLAKMPKPRSRKAQAEAEKGAGPAS